MFRFPRYLKFWRHTLERKKISHILIIHTFKSIQSVHPSTLKEKYSFLYRVYALLLIDYSPYDTQKENCLLKSFEGSRKKVLSNQLWNLLQDAEEVRHLWTGGSLPVGNQSLWKETPTNMRLFEIQSFFLFFFFLI